MKAIIVNPNVQPEIIEIENTLEGLQNAVGGYIEAVYFSDDPVALLCDEEGKYKKLVPNRAITDDEGHIIDIIVGTFLIVGVEVEECEFTDLSDELANKYLALFNTPFDADKK